MLGDINVYLDGAQNPRSQLVANLMTEFGLVDLMHHFWQRIHFHHLKTWTQVRQGTMFRARFNYIIGTNQCLFDLLRIKYMSNYSSDHFSL